MTSSNILLEETEAVVRNLLAPLKLDDEKKTMYVSKMVDEIFLEAYTALSKAKGGEVDFGGVDPLEIDAKTVTDLMIDKFEFDDMVSALAFATKMITLRYLEQADYSSQDIYGITKKYVRTIKE